VKNPYQSEEFVVKDVITESPTIKTFVLESENEFNFETGQFIEFYLPGVGEAPFTPSSSPEVKNKIDITIMNAGYVTDEIHKAVVPGTVVGIRGPFGKGYPLQEFKGKEILIVGGGVGLAPLRSLLYSLFSSITDYPKIVLKYGAKTPLDIIYKDEIPKWREKKNFEVELTVDNGDKTWKGNVGVVTEIVRGNEVSRENSVAIVCGPPIMMKFTTFKLIELGFKPEQIYLSMEKNMSCGLGKCGHCRLGSFYVCTDGPVFDYKSIKDLEEIWD
jgi:sulfite reductase subunit B